MKKDFFISAMGYLLFHLITTANRILIVLGQAKRPEVERMTNCWHWWMPLSFPLQTLRSNQMTLTLFDGRVARKAQN